MSVDSLIARLGGEEAIAARFGLTPKAVWQWANRGQIPGRWHLPLLAFARESEVPLTPEELLSTTNRSAA